MVDEISHLSFRVPGSHPDRNPDPHQNIDILGFLRHLTYLVVSQHRTAGVGGAVLMWRKVLNPALTYEAAGSGRIRNADTGAAR